MTEFFVVRHGQSLGNASGVFVGQGNLGLSELGVLQAKRTGGYFGSLNINKIISSDLERAYDTASYIGKACRRKAFSDTCLREINGGLWQGKTFDFLKKNYPNYNTWLTDIGNAKCDGGESVVQMAERVSAEFDKLAKLYDGGKVCVVTHATPIRAMCCIWNGMPVENLQNVGWVSNCSVTHVIYDRKKRILDYVGYDRHLEGIKTQLPSNV